MPLVGTAPNTKQLFFRLSVLDDELLSTLKIKTFLAKSLSKLYKLFPSNAVPQSL